MYVMMKKLKMAKIKCTYFRMRVWRKVCFMLTKVHRFCGRNKMYKMASFVYRLHGKAFAILIKRSRWYQEITSSPETVSDHNHANTVKNKIGFDIN